MALNNKHANAETRGRWLPAAGIVALLIILLLIYFSRSRNLAVRAVTVERGTISSQISTNGKVEPLQNFEAHAPGPTTVRHVYVHEGQKVKKGQLLLQLDDADARAQAARAAAQLRASEAGLNAVNSGGTREEVLAAEAELVKARTDQEAATRNLEALKRLQTQGAASAGEVHDADNQLQRANAQLHLLEEKKTKRYSGSEIARVQAENNEAAAGLHAANDLLSKTNVRSPLDGVVYSLPARENAFVNQGDVLIEVADLSKVLVRTFVDEPDIGRLTPGQRIDLTWDALPGRRWSGTVTVVPTSVQHRETRNVGELTCIVDNTDMKLLPNVNVGVSIITAEHSNALILPREAVRQDVAKPYVYEIVDGTLKRHEIETSVSNLTQIEVTGLREHAAVALNSTSGKPLSDGLEVRVVP
jgi:HlyD family secretion protein